MPWPSASCTERTNAILAILQVAIAPGHFGLACGIAGSLVLPMNRRRPRLPDAGDESAAPDELTKLEQQFQKEYAAGQYKEAEPTARKIVKLAETKFADQPLDFAKRIRHLADVLYRLKKLKDAEPLYKQVVGLYDKAEASNDADLADILIDLGAMCYDLHRFADAEPFYKRSWPSAKWRLGRMT